METPKLPKVAEKAKLPTLQELFEDNIQLAGKSEALNSLLNHEPKKEWIKEHPFIKTEVKLASGERVKVPHKYLPIDKVEYLLRKIFKKYSIEITGQGTSFNGVWVTVRVHYFNPAIGEMQYQDGIGASQLQTAKGTSPADLNNINNGAISMAFPLAKTLAIKDACQLIGNIFGANLDRKDTVTFSPDEEMIEKSREELRKELLLKNGVQV